MQAVAGQDCCDALEPTAYQARLAAAGLQGVSLAFTHQIGDGLQSAIKATKPAHISHPAAPRPR